MQKKTIDHLQYDTLRVAIIEPTADGQLGLIVAIDAESYVVTNNDHSLYARDTLAAITADLAHLTIDEWFLNVNGYRMNAPAQSELAAYIPVDPDNVSGYIPLNPDTLIH